MCKNIVRRWKYHARVSIIFLFLLALVPFCIYPWWVFYPVYAACVLLLRLYRFYSEKKEKLFLLHTMLMGVLFIALYAYTGLRRKPMYFVLILSVIYIAWAYLADWWMREQIAPSGTLVIGDVENPYPELFRVTGTMDSGDDQKVIEFIELNRVPVVLTDRFPDDALFTKLQSMGVTVVIIGQETTWPRYENLKFVIPVFR